MLKYFFLLLLTLSHLSFSQDWTPEDALCIKELNEIVLSNDGEKVAYEVLTASIENGKWETSIVISQKGENLPITLSPEGYVANSIKWSKVSDALYFTTKKCDRSQIHRFTLGKRKSDLLIDTPQVITEFQPSPDDSLIAMLLQNSNINGELFEIVGESPENAQLFLYDINNCSLVQLTEDQTHVGSIDWSPASQYIVFDHQPSALPEDRVLHSMISKINIATKEKTLLTNNKRSNINPKYSPDGQWIAYSSSPQTWERTFHINVMDNLGTKDIPLALTPDEQAKIVGWLPDNVSLIVVESAYTSQKLYQLSLNSEKIVPISPQEIVVINPSLSTQCETVAFRSESPDMPCEVYVSSIKEFNPTQVSHIQTIVDYPKLKTEIVSWKAKDGLTIEGLLTYPLNTEASSPYPLLVLVKGNTTPVFNTYTGGIHNAKTPYSIGVFASEGYAVLRPYFRGCNGYGRSFRNAIVKDWGGADFEDILCGVDFLVEKGIVHPKRIGMMGWGYGGFITASAITKTNRFNAVSIGGGITNFISFTGTTNTPQFMPYYMGSFFWENDQKWSNHSPLHHVVNVKTPTLIQHCEGDQRVPSSQGAELYNALKLRKVPSKFVLYGEKDHFLNNPKIILEGMRHNLEWFQTYL